MSHRSARLATCTPIVFALLTGCSTVVPRDPVPQELWPTAQVPNLPDVRFWGNEIPSTVEERISKLSDDQLKAEFPALYNQPHNYLAISGGGSEGAYGAGLLVGWTAAGNRPDFQVVSGVSTGALIAPFAYLGPDYDPVLRKVYTTLSTDDIMTTRAVLSVPFSDSVADSAPLANLIRDYLGDDEIAAIATAHRQGRMLFIGTTDLDQMRARHWNIGKIAASGQPGAKALIHKIILASASIPAAFSPVKIQVEADGRLYDELHVDGGTTTQVFVYPAAVDWRRGLEQLKVPSASTYVIRNAQLAPDAEIVPQKLVPIASRSISSLIRTQGIGDLFQIYMLSVRDGVEFNLAHIPESFEAESEELFDPAYMNELFDLGYRNAKGGYPWMDIPPGWHWTAAGR